MTYAMSYHNTTEIRGKDMFEYEQKAQSQEQIILDWFNLPFQATRSWTPSDVQRSVMPGAPITSVRRAMTNLTKAGKLVKAGDKMTGPYGRPEYLWRLNRD